MPSASTLDAPVGTFDPAPLQASLFVVPYDLGLDGYLDAKQCKNRRKCTGGHPEKVRAPRPPSLARDCACANPFSLPRQVQEVLQSMGYFARHGGADHVVLWSLGQYHPWPFNHCDTFMRDFCAKCAFTCYWMDPTKADNRFVSVPFPSGYHWWDGIKELPWAVPGRDQDGGPGARYTRNLTAVYLGSTQVRRMIGTAGAAHVQLVIHLMSHALVYPCVHWRALAPTRPDRRSIRRTPRSGAP